MFDIPVDEKVFIYGDNQSVLFNALAPESTLNKKLVSYNLISRSEERRVVDMRL